MLGEHKTSCWAYLDCSCPGESPLDAARWLSFELNINKNGARNCFKVAARSTSKRVGTDVTRGQFTVYPAASERVWLCWKRCFSGDAMSHQLKRRVLNISMRKVWIMDVYERWHPIYFYDSSSLYAYKKNLPSPAKAMERISDFHRPRRLPTTRHTWMGWKDLMLL